MCYAGGMKRLDTVQYFLFTRWFFIDLWKRAANIKPIKLKHHTQIVNNSYRGGVI